MFSKIAGWLIFFTSLAVGGTWVTVSLLQPVDVRFMTLTPPRWEGGFDLGPTSVEKTPVGDMPTDRPTAHVAVTPLGTQVPAGPTNTLVYGPAPTGTNSAMMAVKDGGKGNPTATVAAANITVKARVTTETLEEIVRRIRGDLKATQQDCSDIASFFNTTFKPSELLSPQRDGLKILEAKCGYTISPPPSEGKGKDTYTTFIFKNEPGMTTARDLQRWASLGSNLKDSYIRDASQLWEQWLAEGFGERVKTECPTCHVSWGQVNGKRVPFFITPLPANLPTPDAPSGAYFPSALPSLPVLTQDECLKAYASSRFKFEEEFPESGLSLDERDMVTQFEADCSDQLAVTRASKDMVRVSLK